jgi:hypothetical protein
MKTRLLKIILILLLFCLIGAGCEKEEILPPNHAKGKIITVTAMCYGEVVLIEVENPKGIGLPGTFSLVGEADKKITYKNGILVPYFYKIGLPNTVPQAVETWLYFEYREFNEKEKKENLYASTNGPTICTGNYIAPSGKPLIITKVFISK